MVPYVAGRGVDTSCCYGLIAGSAGRVCEIASACHFEIEMTMNATKACVEVIKGARPALCALVFLCWAASWPPSLSNTNCTINLTMEVGFQITWMARSLLRQTKTDCREGTHGRPQRKNRKDKEHDVNLGNTTDLATTPAPHPSESKKSRKPCASIIGEGASAKTA